MAKYDVRVEYTVSGWVEVEAEDEASARDAAIGLDDLFDKICEQSDGQGGYTVLEVKAKTGS